MEAFNLADLTDLELAPTHDALLSRLDHVIQSSSTVEARVEKISVATGEYAVLIRGVIKTGGSAPAVPH